jgi:hypothetical protein
MPKINEDFLKSRRKKKAEERPDDFYIPSPKTSIEQASHSTNPPEQAEIDSSSAQINLSLNPSKINSISDQIKLSNVFLETPPKIGPSSCALPKDIAGQLSPSKEVFLPIAGGDGASDLGPQLSQIHHKTSLDQARTEQAILPSDSEDSITTTLCPKGPHGEIGPRSNQAEINSISAQNNLSPSQFKATSNPSSGTDSNFPSSSNTDLNYFDVTPFIPNGASQSSPLKEKRGVFAIPHVIFEFRWKAIESKIELMVFDCLLRFTLGFHRAQCVASNSFIAEWTGLHPPNVRKALKGLMESGLIKRLEVGSVKHQAASFEIPLVRAYLSDPRNNEYQRKGIKFGTDTEIESISDQINPSLNQSESSDQINLRTQLDSSYKKERSNKKINKTLSAELEDFLSINLISDNATSKEREKIFFLVSKGKDQNEILELAQNLIAQGALNGEKCDRPFSYLASGPYEKILQRSRGTKDFDPMRVYRAIGRYNTREPLPEDFASTMTPSENEWIEKSGGRPTLGMWSENKLKQALRIS